MCVFANSWNVITWEPPAQPPDLNIENCIYSCLDYSSSFYLAGVGKNRCRTCIAYLLMSFHSFADKTLLFKDVVMASVGALPH